MKLAKTLLACVVTLALIGTMAVAAFAATPEVSIAVDKASVAIGEDVTVTVTLKNATGAEDGAIKLAYDGALLSLKSCAGGDAALGMVVLASTAEELAACDAAGTVKNSFAITNALADDDAHVVYTAVFTAKAAGAVAFALTEDSYVTITGEEAALEAAASVTVTDAPTTAAPTTAAPTTAAPATDAPSTTAQTIVQSGDAGIAAIAGLVVLAGAAFVATKKKSK